MQDGKNLVVAILLCLLVVIGWSYLGEHMGWAPKPAPQQVAQQQAGAEQAAAPTQPAVQQPVEPLPVFTESKGKEIVVTTPLYTAKIYTGGGILRSFELNNFRTSVAQDAPKVDLINATTAAMAPLGLLVNGQPSWSTGVWSCESGDITVAEGQKQVLRLVGQVSGVQVVRELIFDASTYKIDERVALTPLATQGLSVRLGYTVGADASNAHGGQYDAMRVGWDNDGSLKEESDADKLRTGVLELGKIYWGGAMSTYFFNGVVPAIPEGVTFKGLFQNGVYRAALELAPVNVVPGQETVLNSAYWLGPKDREMMEASVGPELAKSVDLGMFSLIAKGLLWILSFFYGYVHNWGVAIILLTILIKIIFWPLTAKSYSSMEKMKRLAPMMQKIKEKHKDNKEALNKETMALYKTYGVNPASGCIPILIQMPVFFGLYQALLTSVELRHAPFITTLPFTDLPWLADLSAMDPYYITPIAMGLTMLIQQRLSPPATDRKQQIMMTLLPIVFTFLFLTFPSGLVVYWLVNNIISIGQQWLMSRKMKLATPKKKSDTSNTAKKAKA